MLESPSTRPSPPTTPRSPTPPPRQSPSTTPRSPTPPPRDRSIPMDTDEELSLPPRPDDLQESAIADSDPVDVSASSTTGATYKIVRDTSIRGKDKLFDSNGYAYTVKRRTARCTTWRCTQRSKKIKCAATVRQAGATFVVGPRRHVHQPSLAAEIVATIAHQAKLQADDRPFHSAGEIVGDLVAEFVAATQLCPALPALERMAANANYHRRRHRPQHPQDQRRIQECGLKVRTAVTKAPSNFCGG